MVCCGSVPWKTMTPAPGTVLSRLITLCAMLCMAATLCAGFASVQNSILNLQHQASGDIKLADGGWVKACIGALDDCDGHIEAIEIHDDGMGPHHHHHGQEAPSALPAQGSRFPPAILAACDNLKPGRAAALNGRSPGTLDQPPRV